MNFVGAGQCPAPTKSQPTIHPLIQHRPKILYKRADTPECRPFKMTNFLVQRSRPQLQPRDIQPTRQLFHLLAHGRRGLEIGILHRRCD
jgi:hypothetical protein